jgi:hypothetical protein
MADPTEVLELAKKMATEVVDKLASQDLSEEEFVAGVKASAELFEATSEILNMLIKKFDQPTVH